MFCSINISNLKVVKTFNSLSISDDKNFCNLKNIFLFSNLTYVLFGSFLNICKPKYKGFFYKLQSLCLDVILLLFPTAN